MAEAVGDSVMAKQPKIPPSSLHELYRRYSDGESMGSLAKECGVNLRSLGRAFDRCGFPRLQRQLFGRRYLDAISAQTGEEYHVFRRPRQLTRQVVALISDSEYESIALAARKKGLSISAWARDILSRAAKDSQ